LLHQPPKRGVAERRETFGCCAKHPWGVSCASLKAFTPVFDGLWTRVNALMTRDTTPRSAFRIVSGRRPSMSEAGDLII
jgi:hypothetical protein